MTGSEEEYNDFVIYLNPFRFLFAMLASEQSWYKKYLHFNFIQLNL